jgi:hypothetical protein
MMPYLRFLWSVLQHKYFVFVAGRRLGVGLWQLLIHDLSKFSSAEFGPYARRFGGGRGGKADHAGDPPEWRDAWKHHWTRNPHHWEYWCGGDGAMLTPMPEHYAREMVADWCGASRGYTGRWDITAWYAANRERIILHPTTRALVDQLVAEWQALEGADERGVE